MRVLVACEESQQVTLALRQRGIEAWSCDLKPARLEPRWHIQDDAKKVIRLGWDGLIAHPVCDRLTNAGVRWLEERNLWAELDEGAAFFRLFLDAHDIPVRVIENPIPHKYAVARIGRKYDQLVQPHHFGDPFFKATCFWLHGARKLKRTHWMKVPTKKDNPKEHAAWSMVHRASPGPQRKEVRSKTFPGIAGALADLFVPDLAVAA
jgi:hypothetical protein